MNGNNMNWDYVNDLKQTCVDCEAAIKELWRSGLRGKAFATAREEQYEMCNDMNHTHRYTSSGFSIYHNTNTNDVWVEGNPPWKIYTAEYLLELFFDDSTTEDTRNRIWWTLRDYYGVPNLPTLGVHTVANTCTLQVYKIGLGIDEHVWASFNNSRPYKYKLYRTAKGRSYFSIGGIRYHLDEFVKVGVGA